jgi:hypothetical protein
VYQAFEVWQQGAMSLLRLDPKERRSPDGSGLRPAAPAWLAGDTVVYQHAPACPSEVPGGGTFASEEAPGRRLPGGKDGGSRNFPRRMVSS